MPFFFSVLGILWTVVGLFTSDGAGFAAAAVYFVGASILGEIRRAKP
jgi:hypothetical protein